MCWLKHAECAGQSFTVTFSNVVIVETICAVTTNAGLELTDTTDF